jgi:hypothetical protein|tara:strand:+ start:261 stop:443 length:183 start_codon:yes stop_codon:yes gene_type:complete
MNEEQQEAWIVERATFLRQVDDSRLVMESIDIAVEDLQQNADADGNIKAPDALPYEEDFE